MENKISRYRIQYDDENNFGEFSEWFEAGTSLPNINILGIHVEQQMTIKEWNAYAKEYLNEI